MLKRQLVFLEEWNIEIDALAEGEDLNITITRPEFGDMCKDLFNKSISLIEKVLEDSNLTKDQIDEIILTGGSTRIPRIQQIIRAFFDGKELNYSINSQEVYVYGAAVEATINNLKMINLED